MSKPSDLRPVKPNLDKPFDKEIDLPVGKGIILVHVPRMGYSVVVIETQGDKVISRVMYSGPDPRPVALEQLKLATVRHMSGVTF